MPINLMDEKSVWKKWDSAGQQQHIQRNYANEQGETPLLIKKYEHLSEKKVPTKKKKVERGTKNEEKVKKRGKIRIEKISLFNVACICELMCV